MDDDGRPPFTRVVAARRDETHRSRLLATAALPARHARQPERDGADESKPGRGLLAPEGSLRAAATTTARLVTTLLTAVSRALATGWTATRQTVSRTADRTGSVVRTTAGRTGQGVRQAAGVTGVTVSRAAGATGQAIGSAAAAAGTALGGAAATVRRAYEAPVAPGAQRGGRFDPTPYVLALMLALVLFGFLWAVGVLTGDSDGGEDAARPAGVEQTPAPAEGGSPAPAEGAAPAQGQASASAVAQ